MALIPTNTRLEPDKIPLLKTAIDRRVKKLSKLRYGQTEESLWLMDEVAHLRELLKFNQ